MAGVRVRRQQRNAMSEINVVPYIDVMLVLLVIFMATAPMMTQGVSVDLPETSSAAIVNQEPPVVITVSADGRYHIDIGKDTKTSTSLKEVTSRVQTVRKHKPDTLFLIEGDRNVPYGKVVTLMAHLQSAGVDNVGLVTEPPGRS